MMLPRVRSGAGFPLRMSFESQWNRRAAMPKPITVTPRPKMILISTDAPLSSQFVEQGRWRIASTTWDSHAAQRIVGRHFPGIVESPHPDPYGSTTPVGCLASAHLNVAAHVPSLADSGPRRAACRGREE